MLSMAVRLCLLVAVSSPVAASSAGRLPVEAVLPLALKETLAVGVQGRNDKQATLATVGTAGFELVYQSGMGVNLDDLQLYSIRSADGEIVGSPRRLSLGEAPIVASPAFVASSAATFLYFSSSTALKDSPTLWRARFDGRSFAAPEELLPVLGLKRMTGWPQWVDSTRGVSLSFRDGRSRPQWALSGDSTRWFPRQLGDVAAAYVRVVPMTGGGWLLSYQMKPTGVNTLTFVSFSEDGETWSAPEPAALPAKPALKEVHDAFALPRSDRGVDIYYSYPSPKVRVPMAFQLYRRALIGPGTFGPEEQLTEAEAFDPYSSSAHRLQDGKVLLTFSNIEEDSSRGVVKARLHLAKLPGDAPLPPTSR